MKYRAKPIVLIDEAMQLPLLDVDATEELIDWLHRSSREMTSERDGTLAVGTRDGIVIAQPGDWIVRDVFGEYCPMKPDVFEATYELVEE